MLTEGEKGALSAYASEATYFHAVDQGRQEELASVREFQTFVTVCKSHRENIDSAIAKCSLNDDLIVYSGHGRGINVLGSLNVVPNQLIGMQYNYRGYISTSAHEQTATESFLAKRAYPGSRPTLLEFRLSKGFCIFDMRIINSVGESEFLIGRNIKFKIIEASYFSVNRVTDSVLRLVLEAVI